MSKQVSEITLEELWHLFPISQVKHRAEWKIQYESMASRFSEALAGVCVVRVSHIGSTAVENIWAKDIVDILVEANDNEVEEAALAIESIGFTRMSEGDGRISLNLGYTTKGFSPEVFHVHVRRCGNNDELYFRDHLMDHPEVAYEYERMKLELWKQFEHDRDSYTNAKTSFVREWTEKARRAYGKRY